MIHWPFQDIPSAGKEAMKELSFVWLESFSQIQYATDVLSSALPLFGRKFQALFKRHFKSVEWLGRSAFHSKKQYTHLLKGYTLKLRWLVGKKIIEEVIEGNLHQSIKKRNCVAICTDRWKTAKKKNQPNEIWGDIRNSQQRQRQPIYLRNTS